MSRYVHVPHPHIQHRKNTGPVTVAAQLPKTPGGKLTPNARIALVTTRVVGSMWCAYAFGLFDLISLPAAIRGGSPTIVSWVAQTFLQLVLLSVIMVGQNVQAAASDKRAEATYDDAEMVLHEALELQRHLEAQDEILDRVVTQLSAHHTEALALAAGNHGDLAGRLALPVAVTAPAGEVAAEVQKHLAAAAKSSGTGRQRRPGGGSNT